jgi:hypothetical protein
MITLGAAVHLHHPLSVDTAAHSHGNIVCLSVSLIFFINIFRSSEHERET